MGPTGSGVWWRVAAAVARATGVVAVAAGAGALRAGTGGAVAWIPAGGRRSGGLALVGCALVLLAGGLRRRMLVAGLLTAGVVLVFVARTAHGSGGRAFAAALALVGAALTVHEAVVWPTRQRLASAARAAGLVAVVLVGAGVAAAWLAGGRSGSGPASSVLHRALDDVVGRGDADGAAPPLDRAVARGLPVGSAVGALVVLGLLLLPLPDTSEVSGDVRRNVAALVHAPDSDSLAPFSDRRDKHFVFSPDARAAIGYRVVLGVCIAGPGPIGAADAADAALDAWVRRCDAHGWHPAMIGASDAGRELAVRRGLHGIRIGDEAVVPVAGFRLDRPAMRNVRQAVQRTRNADVVVSAHREGQLDAPLRAELDDVVDEWRRGHGELGFAMTMDGLLDGTHPDAVLLVARHHGRAVGFQRYVVCGAARTLSLDVMPRRRDAPNGVNERLIVSAVDWAEANGIGEVSLNFAAFRTWFEAEPSAGTRTLRWVAHRLDPLLNVESLYRFNAKFRPRWVPRHVLYRSALDLPLVLAAALRVEFARRGRDRPERPATRRPASASLAGGRAEAVG